MVYISTFIGFINQLNYKLGVPPCRHLAYFLPTEAETLPLFVGMPQAHPPDECDEKEEAGAWYGHMMLDCWTLIVAQDFPIQVYSISMFSWDQVWGTQDVQHE